MQQITLWTNKIIYIKKEKKIYSKQLSYLCKNGNDLLIFKSHTKAILGLSDIERGSWKWSQFVRSATAILLLQTEEDRDCEWLFGSMGKIKRGRWEPYQHIDCIISFISQQTTDHHLTERNMWKRVLLKVHDNWLGPGPLRNLIHSPLKRDEHKANVNMLINEQRWDFSNVSFASPDCILKLQPEIDLSSDLNDVIYSSLT